MVHRSEPSGPPLLVAAFGGRIFGLNPATGERLWQFDTHERVMQYALKLAVDGGRVYALGAGWLNCLEQATGRGLWAARTGACSATLLVVPPLIFAAGGGEVRCFREEGTPLWNEEFKRLGTGMVSLAAAGLVAQADQF